MKSWKKIAEEKLPVPDFLEDLCVNLHLVPGEEKRSIDNIILKEILQEINEKNYDFREQLLCHKENFFDVHKCLVGDCGFDVRLCFLINMCRRKNKINLVEKK